MKRLYSMILCLCMMFCVGLTASADREEVRIIDWHQEHLQEIIAARRTPIQVCWYKVTKVKKTGGINIEFRFRNYSGKDIKYVKFNVVPYNRVDDPISCDITGNSEVTCTVIGPIESEDVNNPHASSKFYCFEESIWLDFATLYNDNGNYVYTTDYLVDEDSKYYPIGVDNFLSDITMTQYKFEDVWYNKNIEYFKIASIHIDYMDGTSDDPDPNDVVVGMSVRPHSSPVGQYDRE